ncbi:MAG: hypothetical protein JW729_03465, partial [Bacteroidales bacterium]|nr:hypothetical protein [Bacteroidales bacterium]
MQKKTTSLASFQLLIILLVVHVLCLKQSFGQNTQTFDALRQVQGMMDRDLDSALIAIERFETRYKEVIHTGMSEETALLHAQIYIGLGQMHQADSLINFVKNRPIKNSSPEYRARLFLFKSMAYELEEMYPTAVWQLNQAEAIFLDLNDNQGRLDVYQQFAKIYSKLGNYAKAIEMTERLISLHQDLESEEIEMDLLLQGSEYANKMQNLDLQHDFLIKAESLIIANSMNKHSAKLLYAWANYLRSSANFKQAIDYYNVAEKEIEKSKNRRFLCLIYQEKAAIYKMELNEFGQILYLK